MQGFQNGGPGSPATNPLPGLGVFNLTFPAGGDDSLWAGRSDLRQRKRVAADLEHRALCSGSESAHALHPQLQFEPAARSAPGHRFASGLCRFTGGKLFRVRDINQATPGPASHASSGGLSTHSSRSFRSSTIWRLPPTPITTPCKRRSTATRARPEFLRHLHLVEVDRRRVERHLLGTRGVSFPQDSFNCGRTRRVELRLCGIDSRRILLTNWIFFESAGSWPKRLTEGWQFSGIYTGRAGCRSRHF